MGGGSLSGSYSKSNIDADYASVKEQSGVVAGDGGYQVTVAEHTDLKGGIITSTQKAEAEGLNSFSTGTLSVSDVENHMHYEGDSFGISTTASYSFKDPKTQTGQTTTTDTPKAGQKEGRFGVNKSVGYGSEGESQTSITKSAINTSNIKVTDQKAQKATGISTEKIIAQVHTDTAIDTIEADSGALVNNFDAVEVQKELDVQTRVTQTFDTTRQEVKSYLNTKIDNANEIIEDKSGKYTKEQIAEAYQTVDDMQQLGVLVDSISGALYTPSDSALGTVANALAPEISYQIGQYFKKNEFLNDLDNGDRPEEGSAAHILAHAIVAGLVAEAAGNDALSAAISAGGAEVLAPELGKWLYGEKDPSKLTSEQKETVSAILSLGSSALTSATGGSNTDIAASGIASSVAVENNRALLQAERTWLEDEKNIEAFAEYYKKQNGIELSLEEAALILARGGASLVDKSYYDALGVDDNFDYDDARDFIQQNYTDTSTLEYNDPNSPTGTYLTHGFSPDSYEYENRYANLQGFYENKDFYVQYLNLSDGSNDASILDYGEGAFNPFTQLAYTFEKDPFGTIGAVGEGLLDFAIHPIDGLQEVGMQIAELKSKGDLDTLLNDDVSAAQHYGEAASITASVLMPGAVEGTKALKKGLNNAVDSIETPNINSVDDTVMDIEEIRDSISTANSAKGQVAQPRNLEEGLVVQEVLADPEIGKPLDLNNDPLFHKDDGFIKMSYSHKLPDETSITVHYQYNKDTGKVYDIKFDSPEPNPIQPGISIKEN